MLTFSGVSELAISDDGGVLYAATTGGGVFRLQAESIVPEDTTPRIDM